jgi:type II secretory pathway component PulF
MPTFTYRALTAKGETQSGTMEAPDRRVVLQRLRSKQMRPVEVNAKGGPTAASAALTAATSAEATAAAKAVVPTKFLEPEQFQGEATALGFLKKLHQLHAGGMPLGDSIRLLSVRVSDPRQSSLANRIWRDLSEGRTLATSMRSYPKTFDTATVHLIEAGESTGNLIPVLENLIAHLEERAELQKKILAGLAYPVFLCFLAFGVVLLVLYVLLPRIRGMMDSMGGQMTWVTRTLIALSQSSARYGPIALVIVVIAAVSIAQWRKGQKGRAATDDWALRVPMLKHIFLNIDVCRISNLCATLLESGVNTTETLRMTERSIQNTHVQSRFSAARVLINDGASFSAAFRHFHVLPDLDLDMLAVGENTGNIAKSFREIYRNHNRELSEQFRRMTIIISSAALGFAFCLVTILALSIVSSVLNMAGSISSHH